MDQEHSVPPVRVVIADDDNDIRMLIEISVRRAGFELASAAADGDSAWEAIQRVKPDLVVLDVSMPGMTGLKLCRLIRAEPDIANTRILLLSAGVDEESRQAGLIAGANGFIAKPFSPRELTAQLAEFMSTVATS